MADRRQTECSGWTRSQSCEKALEAGAGRVLRAPQLPRDARVPRARDARGGGAGARRRRREARGRRGEAPANAARTRTPRRSLPSQLNALLSSELQWRSERYCVLKILYNTTQRFPGISHFTVFKPPIFAEELFCKRTRMKQ